MTNQVRIIGGKWRGRKIFFPEIKGLRPTQDRVRETLFNWLAPYIKDSQCLDLFAGSGVLGFEAISRGAKKAILVDQNKTAVAALRENKIKLVASEVEILQETIPGSINFSEQTFDLVFLDPPFNQSLLLPSLRWLFDKNLIKKHGLVYLEYAKTKLELPKELEVIKRSETKSLISLLASFR